MSMTLGIIFTTMILTIFLAYVLSHKFDNKLTIFAADLSENSLRNHEQNCLVK